MIITDNMMMNEIVVIISEMFDEIINEMIDEIIDKMIIITKVIIDEIMKVIMSVNVVSLIIMNFVYYGKGYDFGY